MSKVSYNLAMAKSWEKEVEHELEQVTRLMLRVEEECQGDDYVGDVILEDIHDKGEAMIEATKELDKQFHKLIDLIADITKEWEKAIEAGLDKLKQWGGNFHMGN